MNDEPSLNELAGCALIAGANLMNEVLPGLHPSRLHRLNYLVATGCLAGVETLAGSSGTPSISIVVIYPDGKRELIAEVFLPTHSTAKH